MREVSIHAFRGEGDDRRVGYLRRRRCFNPRLPGGRRPWGVYITLCPELVSIHAFRGEGDTDLRPVVSPGRLFQSTPSGGKATPWLTWPAISSPSFNPRLPGGRRRARSGGKSVNRVVSIHAFRGEGDIRAARNADRDSRVSIHAFRGEGDGLIRRDYRAVDPFQSTPSGGKATPVRDGDGIRAGVSIHAFRGEGDTLYCLVH